MTQPVEIDSKTQDLVQQATSKVAQAVDRLKMGEDTDYAVGLTVVPQEGGQTLPVLVLTLGIPALVSIGEKTHGTVLLPNLWIGQPEVDGVVEEVLKSLRDNRSKSLEAGKGLIHPT